MIDAISSRYSSSHAGRLKFNSISQNHPKSLNNLFTRDADNFATSVRKTSDLKSYLVVTGGAAALGTVISTLFSAEELSKGNFSMIKDIGRVAVVMGAIGGLCFATFKFFEDKVLDKVFK